MITKHSSWYGINIGHYRSQNHLIESIFDGSKINPGFACAFNAVKAMETKDNSKYRNICASATHVYADGMPIVWFLRKYGFPATRIRGSNFWLSLIQKTNIISPRIFLYGGNDEVLNKTKSKLLKNEKINLVGAINGYENEDYVLNKILELEPDLIFVARGSPTQEEFIFKARQRYSKGFYVGLGGSFDVYSGIANDAPRILGDLGLEWLYRVFKNPNRIKKAIMCYPRFIYLLIAKISYEEK